MNRENIITEGQIQLDDRNNYQPLDSRKNRFSTCAHITNLLKHFSTQTTTVATQQALKKGFVKEEALRLLRTNSSKLMFEENIKNFRTRLTSRGYPNNLVEKILSEVKFAERKNALTQKTESAQENSTL